MSTQSKKINRINWFTLNPKFSTTLFFIVLFSILTLVIHQRYRIIEENRRSEINAKLESVEMRLGQLLNNTQNIVLTIALTLDQNGVPHNFTHVAKEILVANPIVKSLQLLTQGKITYVYPLKGNESALGLDLFNTTPYNTLEAQKTIDRREMYFQGPIKLVQGEMGVIGRLPIFRNQNFWGFAAVVISLEELLAAAGVDKNHRYYKFQFSKVNPVSGRQDFFMSGVFNKKHTLRKTKTIREGDWKIHLVDTRPTYTDYQLVTLAVVGTFFIFLSGFLLFRALNKQLQLYLLVKKQREKLITAENKYKLIFANAGVGIGRLDSTTGTFLEANTFLCDLLGYSPDELTARKIKSFIHPEDVPADTANINRLKSGEIREFSSVIRYIHKNRSIIWGKAIVNPLWLEGEQPDHHIVIIHDISKQVAYEAELIASQKRIEDLVNSIEGVVWEANIGDEFINTFVSNKVFDILGYTTQEWLSRPNFHFDRVHEEDKQRLIEFGKTEMLTKRQHVNEYRMLSKEGDIVWVRDIITLGPELGKLEKMRGIMIDITHLKNSEDTLLKSFDLVNDQNKRLLNFSHIVSHNLRSHASNIDGITSLIANAESEEERDQMVELLQKVVKNLNDTLYNLNNIVDIQAAVNLVKEPLNLREYLETAIRTQEAQILSLQATITNNVPTDVYVRYNKAYLESVLLNLISNALRYSHPLRKPHVIISLKSNSGVYVLSVIDNGVGIDLNKNGSKLFGLNQTFYGNSDARGFGLFITKNQIEAMDGRVEVESVLNEGTTFKIFFN